MIKMVKKEVILLWLTRILPLQLSLIIGGVVVIGPYSAMMQDFGTFLATASWQGFLRPVDMRVEIEKLGSDLMIYGQLFHLTLNLMMVYYCMNFFIAFLNEAHNKALVCARKLIFSNFLLRLVYENEWIGLTTLHTYGH